MRVRLHLVLLLVLVPVWSHAVPALEFEEDAVVAGGVTPGAPVAWIGVARDRDGFMPHRLSVWQVVDADATGVARLELGQPVPATATFVAVDLAAGEMAVAAPAGTLLREVAFPHQAIPASLRRLDDARSNLAVLWARPATDGSGGAWGGAVSDGGGRDGDAVEDHRVQVLLDLLEPLGTSPAPPETLAAGDVLVGIDLDTLDIYAVRLVR